MSNKRTRTRTTNKSKAKGTANVERDSDGLPVPSEVYEPGNALQEDFDEKSFYRFNLEQLEFLKEYARDCDPKRAAAALKLNKRTIDGWLMQEKFKAEIAEIQAVWRNNWKMTAENAAAKHIQIMQKLEQDYDNADPELRAKFANPLTKASETYLKAAGHMNHGGAGGGESQVVINIDLGDAPSVEVEKGDQKAKVSKE